MPNSFQGYNTPAGVPTRNDEWVVECLWHSFLIIEYLCYQCWIPVLPVLFVVILFLGILIPTEYVMVTSVVAWRRDQLRFLRLLDEVKFSDCLRSQLNDQQVGMAFWLQAGIPPFFKLKEMRASNRGELHHVCIYPERFASLCRLLSSEALLF